MGQECSRGETLPRRRAQCEGFVKGLWRNIKGGAPYIYTCFWPTKNHSNIHNRCVSCSLSGHAAMKDLENQTFTPVMKPRSGPTLPWMVENRRVHTQTSDFQQIRRIVWRRECFFREIITYKGPEGGRGNRLQCHTAPAIAAANKTRVPDRLCGVHFALVLQTITAI